MVRFLNAWWKHLGTVLANGRLTPLQRFRADEEYLQKLLAETGPVRLSPEDRANAEMALAGVQNIKFLKELLEAEWDAEAVKKAKAVRSEKIVALRKRYA
jgi:hypothetical protein